MATIRSALIQSGILSAEEADHYSKLARTRGVALWKILLAENKITETWLADFLSQRLHIPFAGAGPLVIDEEVAHRITESLARQHECIPVAVNGRHLVVAFVDPSDLASVQAIEFFTGSKVQPVVGFRSQVLEAMEEHYSRARALDVIDRAGNQTDVQILPSYEDLDLDEAAVMKTAATPPIIKLVNMIMAEALREHASDIHIEPGEHEIQIRLRVDGVLRDYLKAPAWLQSGLSSRLKILSKLDITERRVPQDGRFKVRSDNRITDLRISTLPTQFGEKVVIRLLGSSEGIPTPDQLGVPAEELPAVMEAVKQPQGMIILTGPTGSGKTTTLYSLLNHKRSSEVNIVTVEDPIEYQLQGANQVQINPKAGLTFAACLRSILRQDPDTILVGEIRDHETAEIAFHAAMTGHLVLTSLHTNNSVATILRLLDLGIDPFMLTSSITLVVAQRLVRVTCDACRQNYNPDPRILDRLGWDDPKFKFSRGKGCKACHGTGFKGRVGIYEFLKMTPSVREAINQSAPEMVIRKAAVQSGMVMLLEAARNKIRQGKTTPEEVMRVIQWVDEGKTSLCPQCGKPVSKKTGKCKQCEPKLKDACTSCGKNLDPTWQVCPHCAAPVLHAEQEPLGKVGLLGNPRKTLGGIQ
ncbi:MAG: ATPase, T2SS/T4P/T4SS family [Acidobacteriota bacterium]|nr:ATPase, T2SS/T4P/T4SS family [Acidobacteriota bacterium]